MKYFGQFFYGKSLLDIAVCLYPVGHFLYNFCIGHWNFFLRNYFRNYLLFYEQVENAFEQDIQSEEELLTDTETEPEIVSEKEAYIIRLSFIENPNGSTICNYDSAS